MEENNLFYISSAEQEHIIASGNDVLDLMGNSAHYDSQKLLLDQAHLSPAFFDLSSGLAGEIFLKLNNYRVKTAVVADLAAIPSQRFQELVAECNKGQEINFFTDMAAAKAWLTK
ncbi:MAG: DUF4180 domain-containing protein [Ardenticatenaceae bacterium]|nr:DUF4180 domain-containing protein [Ardenticatenaceae bacterium]MCB8987207.1 DUF4180 domain-containing protein [Ardenticatenaceae bacterium]